MTITESEWRAELERLGVFATVANVSEDTANVRTWQIRIKEGLGIGDDAALRKFDEMVKSGILTRVIVERCNRLGIASTRTEWRLNRPAKSRKK